MIAGNLGYLLVAHPGDTPAKQSKVQSNMAYIPLPNLERNLAIVKVVNILIAAPWQNAEVQRSGTWSTIRRARIRHVPTIMIWR